MGKDASERNETAMLFGTITEGRKKRPEETWRYLSKAIDRGKEGCNLEPTVL